VLSVLSWLPSVRPAAGAAGGRGWRGAPPSLDPAAMALLMLAFFGSQFVSKWSSSGAVARPSCAVALHNIALTTIAGAASCRPMNTTPCNGSSLGLLFRQVRGRDVGPDGTRARRHRPRPQLQPVHHLKTLAHGRRRDRTGPRRLSPSRRHDPPARQARRARPRRARALRDRRGVQVHLTAAGSRCGRHRAVRAARARPATAT
jgi:hypothetical protein